MRLLIISNGSVPGGADGGGILNNGTLTLTGSTVGELGPLYLRPSAVIGPTWRKCSTAPDSGS